MISDPELAALDDRGVGDFHERFQVGEREGVEVEAPDEQAATVHGGHLCVQHRTAPFVNVDARREEPTVEAPRRRTREWDVALAGEQQAHLHPATGGGGDGTNDAEIGQKVAVGDVDPPSCARKRFQIPLSQTEASTLGQKGSVQRTQRSVGAARGDHLAQPRAPRPPDSRTASRPIPHGRLRRLFVAETSILLEEGDFVVDEVGYPLRWSRPKRPRSMARRRLLVSRRSAGFAQGGRDGAPTAGRAPAVDQHLNVDPSAELRAPRLDETNAPRPTARTHTPPDAPFSSRRNRMEHARIGLLSAVEQLDRFRGGDPDRARPAPATSPNFPSLRMAMLQSS